MLLGVQVMFTHKAIVLRAVAQHRFVDLDETPSILAYLSEQSLFLLAQFLLVLSTLDVCMADCWYAGKDLSGQR